MASPVWGDVPTWIASISSLIALSFAAIAVRFARQTYNIESERDRVNAESRAAMDAFARRAQAALVSAWWGKSETGSWGTFIRNASETPIYQVNVTVLSADDHTDGIKIRQPVVPPSGAALFFSVCDSEVPDGDRRVKLSFTDATGVRWLRNQYGRLTELTPTLKVEADRVRSDALSQFADDFRETYGVSVSFLASPSGYDDQEEFIQDISNLNLVDTAICPHDWLGDLISRDLVEPTVLSPEHRQAFPEWTISALTIDGVLYGLPTTLDTIALFRNTKLAPEPPDTVEDMVSTGGALRDSGRVDHVLSVRVGSRGDPFQIWPLFSSAGGWLFGRRPDGTWDHTHIGLASPESILAFEKLRSLGEAGAGILHRGMDAKMAVSSFVSGRSAYLISTSDAMAAIRKSGCPVEVSPVPPFRGSGPAVPFNLVHALVMMKHGSGKVIAHDLFADYLTHAHVVIALSNSCEAPTALRGLDPGDKLVQQFLDVCELGLPMPAFAPMNATWRILEEAEFSIVCGESAELAARRAAERVSRLYSL